MIKAEVTSTNNPFEGMYQQGEGWIESKPTWFNPHWRSEANCLGTDQDLFFGEEDDPSRGIQRRQARRLCRECPVSAECFVEEMNATARVGVGSFTEGDRAGTTPTLRYELISGEATAVGCCPKCSLPIILARIDRKKLPRARCVGCGTVRFNDDGSFTNRPTRDS